MVIESIHGFSATCEARGSRRSVSLMLLEPGSAVAGDYVLVHQGMAMRAIDPEEAALIWEAFDMGLAAADATAAPWPDRTGPGPVSPRESAAVSSSSGRVISPAIDH